MLGGSCATEFLHVFAVPRSEWFFRLAKISDLPYLKPVASIGFIFDFFFFFNVFGFGNG
jgi:hypothetical protein